MTIDDDRYEKLHDYLDGALPDEERRALEAALASDDDLRAELAALRALHDEAAALPRAIAPERDLWPEIAARIAAVAPEAIDTTVTFRRRQRARRPLSTWVYLAAAAALLLFMLNLPVLLNGGGTPPETPADPLSNAADLPQDPEFKQVAAQYLEARNQLSALLAERRAEIAPETLAVVEENLSLIASAVTEIELALTQEPQSRELERMLYAAYRSEMDLLQQAVKLADGPAASNETDETQGDGDEA